MRGVAAVVSAHDQGHIAATGQQGPARGALVVVGGVTEGVAGVGKFPFGIGVDGLLDAVGDGLGVRGQHGGLVDHAHPSKVSYGVKPFRGPALKTRPKRLRIRPTRFHPLGQEFGFLFVLDHEGMPRFCGV